MADCAISEYVHAVVGAMTFTVGELFGPYFDEACVKLVLAKNRRLSERGGKPWPEDQLARSVRAYLIQLRHASGN